MMHAIAIDDEQMALDIIINFTEKLPGISLEATFVDPFRALAYLKDHPVDVVFLDINMPDISGLNLAENLDSNVKVIFTTAYPEHAVKSYELEAVDYLVKPFSLSRFISAVAKAEKLQQPKSVGDTDFIFLKSGYEQHKVQFKDILYLQSAGNYMEFMMNHKRILSRLTLKETLKLLPEREFIRVHKSYIVAIRQIESVRDNKIFLGEYQVPVSQSYRDELFRHLNSQG